MLERYLQGSLWRRRLSQVSFLLCRHAQRGGPPSAVGGTAFQPNLEEMGIAPPRRKIRWWMWLIHTVRHAAGALWYEILTGRWCGRAGFCEIAVMLTSTYLFRFNGEHPSGSRRRCR
jgi:hypothetical protein